MADGFLIGGDLLGRIRRTVDGAESTAYRMNVPGIPVRFEGEDGGGGEEPIRLGTISSSWLKGTEATVTKLNGDGSAISPTVTFTAKNHFVDISVDCGTKKVACANVGGTWILIAAEC